MPEHVAACLTREQLEVRSRGEPLRTEALAHLSDCPACAARLHEVADENHFLREVQVATRAEARPQPLPTIAGYDLIEEVHRGGQGVVYKALQRGSKRVVALKVPLGGARLNARQQRRFEREIEVVAQLNHPNIVTLYSTDTVAGGGPAFAMEFIDGVALDEYVRVFLLDGQAAPASSAALRKIVALFARTCAAVAYAHQRGVLHRDLKPANILVDKAGSPRVLDFGLGKLLESPVDSLTRDGEFAGTLDYASPEQVNSGGDTLDMRTDVYSLGVILYTLVTGRRPYATEGSLAQRVHAITRMAALPARRAAAIIDEELSAILAKTLMKDRESRYSSAAELHADLENYLSGRPVQAKGDSAWYQVRALGRRYRWPLTAGLAGVAASVTVAIIMSVLYGAAQRARSEAQAGLSRSHIEQARLLASSGSVPAAEDLLWSELAGSAIPPGIEQTDPAFWGLLELYAANPCLRTWNSSNAAETRALRLGAAGNEFFAVHVDGEIERIALDVGPPRPPWKIDMHRLGFAPVTDFPAAFLHEYNGTLWWVDAEQSVSHKIGSIPASHAHRWVASPSGRQLLCPTPEGAWERLVLRDGASSVADWRQLFDADQCVWCAIFTDESHVLTAGFDNRLAHWRLDGDTPRLEWARFDLTGGDYVLHASDDGRLATYRCDDDCRMAIIDARSGALLSKSTLQHVSVPRRARFDWRGERLVALHHNEPGVAVYDMQRGERVASMQGHRAPLLSVEFADDDRQVITGTLAGEYKLWELPGASAARRSWSFPSTVQAAAFDASGRSVVIGYAGGVTRIDVTSGQRQLEIAAPGAIVSAVALLPDGRRLAAARHDGLLDVYDATDGSLQHRFECAPGVRIRAVAAVAETDCIALAAEDSCVHVIDLKRRTHIKTAPHCEKTAAVVASRDGRWIAAGDSCGHVRVYTATDLTLVAQPPPLPVGVRALAFSPDGRLLAATGDDSRIHLFNTADWTRRAMWEGHDRPVYELAFRGDGRILASGDSGGEVRLWDAASGRILLKLERHAAAIFFVAFSPDGRKILSGGQDRTVRLLDLQHYEQHIAGNLEAALRRLDAGGNAQRAAELRAWGRAVESRPRDASVR